MSDLATRLEAAALGSPELSAEVLTVVTGKPHAARFDDPSGTTWIDWRDPEAVASGALNVPLGGSCLCHQGLPCDVTESIDAAVALAESKGFDVDISTHPTVGAGRLYSAICDHTEEIRSGTGELCQTMALAVSCALVNAMKDDPHDDAA